MVIQVRKRSCSFTPSWFVAILSFLDDLGSRGPGASGGTIPERQGRETWNIVVVLENGKLNIEHASSCRILLILPPSEFH
jgi:hypothetical protein